VKGELYQPAATAATARTHIGMTAMGAKRMTAGACRRSPKNTRKTSRKAYREVSKAPTTPAAEPDAPVLRAEREVDDEVLAVEAAVTRGKADSEAAPTRNSQNTTGCRA